MFSRQVRRDIIYSQAAFYATLIICIIIAPSSLTANGGISYFGHHRWTVAPFMVGMFISVYWLAQARRQMRDVRVLKPLYLGLGIIIPSMVGVAIAPAIGSGWIDALHRLFGTFAFVAELILGGWQAVKVKADIYDWLFWGLQWIGGIIALIYLNPVHGWSIEGQLLFQLAFSAILIRRRSSTIYGHVRPGVGKRF